MEFIIVNLVLFIFLIFLLLLLSMTWPPDSPWAPWWKTNKTEGRAAIKLGKITKKDIVYELGSGDGEFCLLVAKTVGAKTIGIEIDPLRYLISKVRVYFNNFQGKITFIRKDFKKVDISSATIIFVYLVPRALERICPKLLKELKPKTKIISYRYKFPDTKNNKIRLIGNDKKHCFYLYEIT